MFSVTDKPTVPFFPSFHSLINQSFNDRPDMIGPARGRKEKKKTWLNSSKGLPPTNSQSFFPETLYSLTFTCFTLINQIIKSSVVSSSYQKDLFRMLSAISNIALNIKRK